MPIDTNHAQYDAFAERWQRCRDVLEGEDAVKAAGKLYLPQPSGQDETEYKKYVTRALFFEATARTHEGLLGMIMRKPPEVRVPDSMRDLLSDITLADTPLESFAAQAASEVLSVGRAGVLADMQDESVPAASRRAFLVLYTAEQILNWHTTRISGDQKLDRVVLHETVEEPDPGDPFVATQTDRFRVLTLEGVIDGGPLSYWMRVYERSEKTDPTTGKAEATFILVDEVQPKIKGQALDFIPFIFLGPESVSVDVQKPPLLGIAGANLSHYRTSADLEWATYFVAHPQIWIAGTDQKGPWIIGGPHVWIFENPQAKVDKLSGTKDDVGALQQRTKDKESMMAALGARVIEESKRAAETAEAMKIRQAGDDSALQRIALSTSQGLTKALGWVAEFHGAKPDDVTVKLNTEFMVASLSSSDLRELIAGWQSGAYAFETLYSNLARAGIARPGIEPEEEKAAIDSDQPVAGM